MQFDLDMQGALDEPMTAEEMAISERLMVVSKKRVKRKLARIKEVEERGASRGHDTYGTGNALSATPDERAGTFETAPAPACPDARTRRRLCWSEVCLARAGTRTGTRAGTCHNMPFTTPGGRTLARRSGGRRRRTMAAASRCMRGASGRR